MIEPFGVILAGGLGRRMGGIDKCLVTLNGQVLLSLVIDRLREQVSTIALNANGQVDRFDGFGLTVIEDTFEGNVGPLAGVLAGMDWAAAYGASTIVSVASDTPFFPIDLVARLEAESTNMKTPLVLAVTEEADQVRRRHPTFGLWSVSLRHDLRQSLESGLRKVVRWTDLHDCREAVFLGSEVESFFNINTPEDLVFAEQML